MNQLSKEGVKQRATKLLVVAIIGILTQIVASYILTIILDTFFEETAKAYSESISTMLNITPYMLLMVCIIYPVIEELFFRLLILGVLKKFIPFIVANIIQAIVFGVYHGNVVQGIYAFILGLFIGYLYYMCGGVIYTIMFHMALNFAGMFLDEIISPSTSMIMKTIIAVLSFTIITGLYYFIIIKKFRDK